MSPRQEKKNAVLRKRLFLMIVLSHALLDKKLFNLDDPDSYSKLPPLFEKREAIGLNLSVTEKYFDGLRWCRIGKGLAKQHFTSRRTYSLFNRKH